MHHFNRTFTCSGTLADRKRALALRKLRRATTKLRRATDGLKSASRLRTVGITPPAL